MAGRIILRLNDRRLPDERTYEKIYRCVVCGQFGYVNDPAQGGYVCGEHARRCAVVGCSHVATGRERLCERHVKVRVV